VASKAFSACFLPLKQGFTAKQLSFMCRGICKQITFFWIGLLAVALLSSSFHPANEEAGLPPFHGANAWADSLLQTMSVDEKLGQLIMIAAYSNKNEEHAEWLEEMVKKHHVGGLIFFQGGPQRQYNLTRQLQAKAKIPLMIGIDAEWGLSMRLDSTMRFPRQMMLGAIANDSLVYEFGREMARQLKTLGVHVSFSPVLDVNNNPQNPVINSRSFGEDPLRVSALGTLYFKGLQDEGVLAVGKHFPGHGDTDVDSHLDLPVLNQKVSRLEALELVPFRRAVKDGIGGIMVAHIHIPAFDKNPNMPTTLSPKVVNGFLRNEMGFEGLIFTDAMNMKGVTKYFKSGEAELKALLAGNDVILFPENAKETIDALKQALNNGQLSEAQLNAHVHRVLSAKHWLGLHKKPQFNDSNLIEKLNTPQADLLNRRLNAAALTLVHHQNNVLPFKGLEKVNILSIALGDEKKPYPFQEALQLYDNVKLEINHKKPTSFERKLFFEQLEGKSHAVVSLHNTKLSPQGNFGITSESLEFVEELATQIPTILVLFGNPYALDEFKIPENVQAVLIAYEESDYAQHYAAEALFGGIGISGILPVSAGTFSAGLSHRTEALGRFHYTLPEAQGISSKKLAKIDSIALKGIKEQAYPGCQVIVARKGQVIYHKAFGHHTYKNDQQVKLSDIYDLASITKIASSAACLMKLDEEGYLNTEQTLGEHLPEWVSGSPYESIVLKDVLTHQAGLKPTIFFQKNALVNGVPRYDVFSIVQNEVYPYRVADNLFIHKNYPDSMMRQIIKTPLNPKKEYLYSDVGYYFTQKIIEKYTGKPLNEVADSLFYAPLGASTLSYLPREKFDINRITPTEYDMGFRKQLVHGDVHDPGAAMLGGVGGHAGLFSNANDLAKLMHVFMNMGVYGNIQFLGDSVLSEYTKCRYCVDPSVENRRGLAFDKPVTEGKGGPTCQCVSLASFGHQGFTGTIAWADPEEDLVYIFLSNRVYPDAQVNKLAKMGIRTDIMQAIYDALGARVE